MGNQCYCYSKTDKNKIADGAIDLKEFIGTRPSQQEQTAGHTDNLTQGDQGGFGL